MFFLRYLEREISIHPSFFGNNVNERLKDQLYTDLEGSCNGEYYIVCIMDITNISPGNVRPGSGEAHFTIQYRAILWKPFKGEAVRQAWIAQIIALTLNAQIDCVVTSIKPQGVFCEAGPLTVFVSKLVSQPKLCSISPNLRHLALAT